MSEEEKKLVEKFKNLYIKDFNGEPITVDDRLSYIECALITNLIEELDKELNSLKEIEQLHQEENGKLRVELEKYKLLDANIEKANKIIKSNELNEKEIEIIETYRKLIEETGRDDWIICNPKTMWSNYFVRKDKIQEKIEEYEGLKILDKQAYEEQIKPLKELLEDNNG